MRKSMCTVIVTVIALAILATGCSKGNVQITPPSSLENTPGVANPFEKQQGEAFMPSSLSHSPTAANLDENGGRLPFRYDGGEFRLDYTVSAAGKAKNVGFLVYVDGISQPYRIDTADAPYEYMHIFNLSGDDVSTPFSFVFTPVTGAKGDTLILNIVSIYNPGFQPDMKDTVSYGMYHGALPMEFKLTFEDDADAFEDTPVFQKAFLQNVTISEKPITNEFLATVGGGLSGKISLEDLNTMTFTELLYNSHTQMDNFKLEDGKTLQLTHTICGVAGATYKTTFYANHQPLSGKDGTAFTTTLSKGGINVITADVDVEKLDEFTTFYAVSVPTNPEDFPNVVIILEKSPSILIYK